VGNVDLSNLTWELFWIGVGYFMITGTLFSIGFIRFAQQRKRSGYLYMAGAAVSAIGFLSYLFTYHI
jgi:hypothetical protein